MAMIMEEKALNLYTFLKETSDDDDLKKIFSFLANEENKHKMKLEKLHVEAIIEIKE
jgi:rubrerythrin